MVVISPLDVQEQGPQSPEELNASTKPADHNDSNETISLATDIHNYSTDSSHESSQSSSDTYTEQSSSDTSQSTSANGENLREQVSLIHDVYFDLLKRNEAWKLKYEAEKSSVAQKSLTMASQQEEVFFLKVSMIFQFQHTYV
jgi:hypothetical protein